MTATLKRISRSNWQSTDDPWRGKVEGIELGTGVTVLFFATNDVGRGPTWHVHPYDEVFIIQKGRALFTIGSQKTEAQEGDVLLGPANVPHKYMNLGPGRLESTDIHLNDHWIQTDLEDPELISNDS